jgi:hypothetical protein
MSSHVAWNDIRAGHVVLARYATALGARLHQAIYFDDGDITAIA